MKRVVIKELDATVFVLFGGFYFAVWNLFVSRE